MYSARIDHWQLDQHNPWRPQGKHEIDVKSAERTTHRAAICCARCLYPITKHTAYLEMAGGHLHVFTNPSGITYELVLYSHASCVIYGPAMTEHTWFTGYAWQLALCSNCHEHLGWRYRRLGSANFYGLIRERICEVNS